MVFNNGKTIITYFENMLPVLKMPSSKGLIFRNRLIFTNRLASTLDKNISEINQLRQFQNCKFVPSYEPAFKYLPNPTSQHNNAKNTQSITLLIGHPSPSIKKQLINHKIVTLQEMCALYPEKVPLSYRSKQTHQIRQKIQKRLSMALQNQPPVSRIIYLHPIEMWDEAIQVVLDHQPALNIIPFSCEQSEANLSEHYQLTMQDFIKAVDKCHHLVHNNQLPQIIDFNKGNKQVQYLMNNVNLSQQKDPTKVIVDISLINNRQEFGKKWPGVHVQKINSDTLSNLL